ncbi:ABC transporter substrate-binding protein [Vacuolonema iberomarrocanum]|uniref:ABC transporter substrate-binding protein n=1 Tax=Vacuolonema iberomarrocanum TaxID=3454632 RepID=UPI0019EF3C61|nr:amino acid ABC transporter substrate-binding protein [filamentous cyanobacterium LEGE 07170]
MSSKNELPVLVVTLVITVALTWGVWALLKPSLQLDRVVLGRESHNPTSEQPSSEESTRTLNDRLSPGYRMFFPQGATLEKRAAIELLGDINNLNPWAEAAQLLEASLQQNPNDPEARIYLNNVRVSQRSMQDPDFDGRIDAILVSVPIESDPNGALEILRGVAQAQEEANAADGRKLYVWIADDANDPAIAQQIATYAAESDFVQGVVGHYASDVTLAAAPIYEDGQVVAISPVSTSVRLSDFSNYFLRTVPSDAVAAQALADYMLETLQQQRATVFYSSESGYSQSLMSEFSSALSLGGGQVVNLVDVADSGFSAQASLEAATQNGTETLVLLPNTGRLDETLQVVQLAQGRFTLLAGDDVYTPKTLEMGGQAAVDMVVAVPWHILAHEGSEFVSASRQLWQGDVNWRTVTAYDATHALIQAFREHPPEPTVDRLFRREQVQQALYSSSFQAMGATEPVLFLQSGDRDMGVQLVRIQSGRSGLAFEFVPIDAQ